MFELLFGKSGSDANGQALPTKMVGWDLLSEPKEALDKICKKRNYIDLIKRQVNTWQ